MDFFVKYCLTVLALIVMFLCPFSLHPAKLHEKHSCYSGIPNTVLCNDIERIAIYDLQYARNCSKCHCYASSSTCGQFKLPGSWENYYYYNTISGTQGSQFTTQRTPCPNSGTGGIYTNLVYLRFECVPEDKITDFCAMSMQTEGESVYLQYTPSENRHKIRDCHCFASSLSGGLQIHAVDIRFQHVQMDSTGACGINQKSYLQFDSENQTIKCIDKHIIGGYTNIYNTSNQNMDILLHLDGEPQSVWIRITATTGTKVNVSCENIPPTEVSTEAIISTKKTTFDVATSKPVKTSTNPEKTKRPINTTDVERTTKVMRTPSIGLITTTETRLTSTQSTEHLSTISVNHHVSQQKLPEETTKAIMSTEKPTLSVMTSKPVKPSMNTEKTKGPVEKTDLEKSTEAVNTSLIDHQATTVETRLTSTQSSEQLSTISDNPQKTLPDKKPTDQPIDPAIIVLALTSFLTFVLVVIGFVIGRSRYVESRLHRKHSNTNQEEMQLDKKETSVNIEQNVHRVYKDDAI